MNVAILGEKCIVGKKCIGFREKRSADEVIPGKKSLWCKLI